MANKLNIDELLKKELSDFQPNAPDGAWDAINQSLPQSASAIGAAASKVGLTATMKATLVIASLATVVTVGTLIYSSQEKSVNNNNVSTEEKVVPSAKEEKIIHEADKLVSVPESAYIARLNKTKNNQSFQDNTVKNQQPVITTKSDVKSAVLNQQPIETSAISGDQILNTKQEATENQPKGLSQEATVKGEEDTKQPYPVDDEFSKPNIPNVFTPNNDGYNDEYVITIENEIVYDLKIMDAKGGIVFESIDKNNHWNGVNQRTGNICEPGVYVFAFRYQIKGMREAKVKQGYILLKL